MQELLMENDLSFYVFVNICANILFWKGNLPGLLAVLHSQIATLWYFFTCSSVTHSPSLPHGIHQLFPMPTTSLHSQISEIWYAFFIAFFHAMPSITELLLSEWWSMLCNDISDLKHWNKIINMQPSWFISSCNASTVHQPLT